MLDYFPELTAISMYLCGIEYISADTLRHYPDLTVLEITGNRLKELPGNLFTYANKLHYIEFAGNQIEKVGLDILEPLMKTLKQGVFLKNTCIDFQAHGKKEIKELTERLKKCDGNYIEVPCKKENNCDKEVFTPGYE